MSQKPWWMREKEENEPDAQQGIETGNEYSSHDESGELWSIGSSDRSRTVNGGSVVADAQVDRSKGGPGGEKLAVEIEKDNENDSSRNVIGER